MSVPSPDTRTPIPDLDALVRRVDEDRWLASRFAPPEVRAQLIALYAVNYEIARLSESVREPGLGAIRLQWWREALGEVFAGGAPRVHPALSAFYASGAAVYMRFAHFERLLDARAADFDAAPFADATAFDAYIDATASGLMRLAMEACGGVDETLAREAGWIWGATGLLRAAPALRARGREVLPVGVRARDVAERVRMRARGLTTPSAIFPAVGYATLSRSYVGAGDAVRAEAPLFTRHLRLVFAAATGRL